MRNMIGRKLNQAHWRLSELERRMNNMFRPAKVTEIDPAKGMAKVSYAKDEDGNDVVSTWVPWTESAGAVKTWSPPSPGEQIILISPSGEIGPHSWITRGGFSNENPQPHDKAGEYVMTVGDSYKMKVEANGNVTIDQKRLTVNYTQVDWNPS